MEAFVVPAGVVVARPVDRVIPERLLLGSVADGRLQVIAPISVRFRTEHDSVVAEAEALDEFGYGSNPSDALRDLQRALAELYFSLEQDQARLGADLQVVWTRLQRTVRRRR
jgi:hypothetical protein